MAITLNGTTGITTPDVTSDGLTVDSTTLVVDEANNRVGIGTSSPSQQIHVNGVDNKILIESTDYAALQLKSGSVRTFNLQSINDGSGAFRIYDETAGTERARIDSSGNLLVGTTSNPQSARLYVQAIGYNATAIRVAANGSVATSYLNGSGAEVGYVQVNASTTAYVTSSDYRLKHDIAPMTGAMAKVAALKPVTYKWNADDSAGEGFIAHELQEVCPSAVTGEKDAVDDNGNPIYQGIDTSFLVATLTAAIQEQQALITAQQTALQEALGKIETLEARVAALEASNV